MDICPTKIIEKLIACTGKKYLKVKKQLINLK